MDILIFDMDGVLLEARGYHRALHDTVQLAGKSLSLDNIELSQEQIYKFESLGISSEWQSSAFCLAILQIQILSGVISPSLDLEEIFSLLQDQPLDLPAIERGLAAFRILCEYQGIDAKSILSTITDCEDINRSMTMQWFQELVLGSETYLAHYKKPVQFNTPSYLKMYDIPLLSPKNAEKIKSWTIANGRGAAIMTNRPSSGPTGFAGSPEAELGMDLVQLSGIPIVGYGDIAWLAENINVEPGRLVKPNRTHALAAIFGSLDIEKELSLSQSILDPIQWPPDIINRLQGGTITVFEDTPAGIVSVQNAGKALEKIGLDIKIKAVGITKEKIKKAALENQGVRVFSDINQALLHLEDF